MKKAGFIIVLILVAGLIVGYFYLLYRVWSVFGFWTILWTAVVQSIASSQLQKLASLRSETSGVVTFNPKEWPKFLSLMVSAAIGYYLYTIIMEPSVSESDRNFGIGYLLILTVVPMVYVLYKLVRDRNDYVSISNDAIEYRDNADRGKILMKDVSKAENSLGDLTLTLADGSDQVIRLSNMNFNVAEAGAVLAEIEKRLPEPSADAAPATA